MNAADQIIGHVTIGPFSFRLFYDGWTGGAANNTAEFDVDILGCPFYAWCRLHYPEPYSEIACEALEGRVPLFCCYHCGKHNAWDLSINGDFRAHFRICASCAFLLEQDRQGQQDDSDFLRRRRRGGYLSPTDQLTFRTAPTLRLFSRALPYPVTKRNLKRIALDCDRRAERTDG